MNYRTLKRLAKDAGLRVADLCALAPKNDPFYEGTPSDISAAQWFADQWHALNLPAAGVHLRRVHYQLVSQSPAVAMPNGAPYQNTDSCWKYLCDAGKHARYLDLVPAEAFVDKRSPSPSLFATYEDDASPGCAIAAAWLDSMPTVPAIPALPAIETLDWPELIATGYDARQYHVEVWAEKTTVEDVLKPLCQRERVNLVCGAGEMSITACLDFLARAAVAQVPARILYVSDYDPAGVGMPISVARKVEYYQATRPEYCDLDIRLQPIVLTADQVARYHLPRVPVKDSDLRKATWQDTHGEGAVELDALEALQPGTLEAIVRSHIEALRDATLARRTHEARRAFQDYLDDVTRQALRELEEERQELDDAYGLLYADYETTQQAFADLAAPFQQQLAMYEARLAELNARAGELRGRMVQVLEDAPVDLQDYAQPQPQVARENGTLYASGRAYLDQLAYYRTYRHSGTLGGAHVN